MRSALGGVAPKTRGKGGLNLGAGALEVATHKDGADGDAFSVDADGRAERLAVFCQHGVVKEGAQAVEVGLADGIVGMVVTLRAADGEAQAHRADGGGDVIEQDVAAFVLIVEVRHVRAGEQEAGGGFIPHQISRDLMLHEGIERHVAIERVDDPVAVLPRVFAFGVVLKAVGVCVAREIQPPLCPVLAVARRGEEAVGQCIQ